MPIISLGKGKSKLYLLIIYFIARYVRHFDAFNEMNSHYSAIMVMRFVTMALAGVLYVIKQLTRQEGPTKKKFLYEYTNPLKPTLIIAACAMFNVTSWNVYYYFDLVVKAGGWTFLDNLLSVFMSGVGEMLFIALFTIIILKTKLFIHKYVALVVIFIGSIIFFIPLGFGTSGLGNASEGMLRTFGMFLYQIPGSLYITLGWGIVKILEKYLLYRYYYDPLALLCLEGVLSCIFYIPFYLLVWYSEYQSYCVLTKNFFLYFAIAGVSLFIEHWVKIKIIDVLTPTHVLVIDYLFYPVYSWSLIEEDSLKLMSIVGLVVVLFGSLLYNEIIIVHAQGLDNNIENNIRKRALQEIQMNKIEVKELIEGGEISQISMSLTIQKGKDEEEKGEDVEDVEDEEEEEEDDDEEGE